MRELRADPGSPRAARVALVAVVVLYVVIAGLQSAESIVSPPEQADASASTPTPDPMSQFAITSKITVKVFAGMGFQVPQMVEDMKPLATSDADRVRLAIVTAFLDGPDAAREQLNDLKLDQTDPLAADVQILRWLFQQDETAADDSDPDAPPPPPPPSLSREERKTLIEHHGWFGRLASVYNLPDEAPARQKVLGGGGLVILLSLMLLGVALAGATGFGLLVTAIVLLSMGKLRPAMRAPMPGGSVLLEMFAVFLASFLLLKIVSGVVMAVGGNAVGMWFAVLAQWVIVLALLWPLARGVGFRELAPLMGWHRGRGVVREVAAGVVGYLAGLPIFFAAAVLVMILAQIQQMILGEPKPPSNPIMEMAATGSPLLLVVLGLLAVVWAPIVEEGMFRGALYRHMRSRVSLLVAGLGSALLFAFMHSYGPLMTPPLIALGFTFAMLREWRGSLIAPMTAHFLHNATTIVFMAVLLRVIL